MSVMCTLCLTASIYSVPIICSNNMFYCTKWLWLSALTESFVYQVFKTFGPLKINSLDGQSFNTIGHVWAALNKILVI